MQIYIEEAGFWRTMQAIQRCGSCFRDETLHYHMLCRRGFSLLKYGCMFWKRTVSSIDFLVDARHLSSGLIRLINGGSLLSLTVKVTEPLTDRQYAKLCRIKGVIRIVDTTDGANRSHYEENRRILCRDSREDQFVLADIYRMTAKDSPLYQCNYTSCLGKTVYIAADGTVSFCPYHAEASRLGTLQELEHIFESEQFLQTLSDAIGRRSRCKQTCGLFAKCKGGCVFADSCESFRAAFGQACARLEELQRTGAAPSELPLYQELALMGCLFSIPGK